MDSFIIVLMSQGHLKMAKSTYMCSKPYFISAQMFSLKLFIPVVRPAWKYDFKFIYV